MKRNFWLISILFLLGFQDNSSSRPCFSTPAGKALHPKNIILMIGDGMGLSQISAAAYELEGEFYFNQFPVVGFQKTFSSDNLITDSAAGATAIACGIKTANNFIGMDSAGVACKTIVEEAEEKGLATGLVVTSSIVHATPASFIAHEPFRSFYENIAADFLDGEVDLLIGGGKQFFDRRKSDERNLIDELKKKGYAVYDYFYSDIFRVKPTESKNFAFFTADNQPLTAFQGRDYLPYASKLAMDFLKHRSDKGFFLMIEGSQIDWSGHANQGIPLIDEMKDFNKTIQEVLQFAKKQGDTLVIVTADHETGGLGLNLDAQPKKPDLVFTTNGHTGTMVPIFAYGPMSELFTGVYDNTAIYHKMRQALGF